MSFISKEHSMAYARMMFYTCVICAGLLGGLADALLNQWAKTGGKIWLVIAGFGCWNVALTIFLFMHKRAFMSQCVMLFILANCFIVFFLSYFWFQEAISTCKWIGIALGILAVLFMELG